MKLTATAPIRNLDDKQSELKTRKSGTMVKSLPKRIKLRAVDVHIPGFEDILKSLRTLSKIQGAMVLLLFMLVSILMVFFIGGKIYDFSIFLTHFWSSIIFMGMASLLTFLITKFQQFQCPYYVVMAISLQFFALLVWLVLLFGGITAFPKGVKVSGVEKVLMAVSFIINYLAAVAAWLSGQMLWSVSGLEALKKVGRFNKRYGDIVFEVVEVKEASGKEPRGPGAPEDDPRNYNLV